MTLQTATADMGFLDGSPMTRRSLLTLGTAAGLTSLYGLYSVTVTPFVKPQNADPEGGVKAIPAPPPPPENIRMAQQHLPTQEWAAKAKYQLRTPDAFIYFNEWEPVEADQAVRFRPFAMIHVQEKRKPDDPPITIVGESAYLRFAKKFEVTDPDPGRVIAGALQGNVWITGPDNFALYGKNFIYSETAMRLWSDDWVQFAWAMHKGRGYGLQVELIADETAKQSPSIAVTGAQSIRLRRNVAVDLTFPQGDRDEKGGGRILAAKPAVPAPAEEGKPDAKKDEPIEVRVRSDGSFEFDVEANVGTFVDNVRVYRPTGRDRYDTLQCDQLTLMLEPESVVAAAAKEAENPATEPSEGQDVPAEPKAPEGTPTAVHRELKDGQREGNFRNLNTRMTLRRVRARGIRKHVVLISESNDLTAHMTDLIYDVPTRVASLASPDQVRVFQGSSEIHAPGMTLMHDASGKLSSVWCQGPGWLKHYKPETRVLELAAQWAQQLRRYSEKETGLDIIELEKQALVRQPEQKMGLAAEFIRLWMEPQDVQAARPGAKSPNGRSNQIRLKKMLAVNEVALVSPEMNAETNRLEAKFEERPADAEMPADGGVTRRGAAAPRSGETAGRRDGGTPGREDGNVAAQEVRRSRSDLKLANFQVTDKPQPVDDAHDKGPPQKVTARRTETEPAAVAPAKLPPLPAAAASKAGPSKAGASKATLSKDEAKAAPRTRPPAKNASRAADAASSDEAPDTNAQKKPVEDKPKENPIQVLADLIRVRVLMGEDARDRAHVAEVWTEGNVEVTQEHDNGDEPLQVTGDKMHVINNSETDQVIHVVGVPAHVRDRGTHIEGRNVHIDRAKNVAWVEGAGLLQLPVNSTLDGQKLDSPQLLDVWWKEKMTFDGAAAQFLGDVRCVLNDSRMLCQQMDVTFTERVNFASRSSAKPQVLTVDCREGVQFDGTEYVASKLTEVRKGHVARFTLDQVTGKTTSHGPGWMTFWRRGNGRRAGMSPGSTGGLGGVGGGLTGGLTPAKESSTDSNSWEYTRVDFVGASDGNVQQRFTTFEERVQIVYGPVERPLAVIDPDDLPKDGGWMRCDKLRLQQHVLAGKKPEPGKPDPSTKDKPEKTEKADKAATKTELAARPADASPSDKDKSKDEKTDKPAKPAQQTHVEVFGSGNAELEGRTFHGRADTISYDESKGLYVLKSMGNHTATIWRQKQVGGEYSSATAQEMRFYPARNHLEMTKTRGLDATP